MGAPATLLMWFQLRSPELAEDFERLMAGDRDIVRGSLDTVSEWRLTRPADVPGQAIGQADYVLIAEIVEVDRFEQQGASTSSAWRRTWRISSRVGECWSCVPSSDDRPGCRSAEPLGWSVRSWAPRMPGSSVPAGAAGTPWPAGGPHRARRGAAVDRAFDHFHPAREELPKLATSGRVFGQAT